MRSLWLLWLLLIATESAAGQDPDRERPVELQPTALILGPAADPGW